MIGKFLVIFVPFSGNQQHILTARDCQRLLNRQRTIVHDRVAALWRQTSDHVGHDLLWKRLRRDRRRPLLQVADPEARLRELSAEREPLYRETAHIVVETEGVPFGRLVDEVVRRVAAEVAR